MYDKFRNNRVVEALLEQTPLPPMALVRQRFSAAAAGGAERLIREAFQRPESGSLIKPGMSIAITAGSRGIANYRDILRETVDFVRARGGLPFLVPAMGSHGGATAEGQKKLLASYGITEETVGCPIHSSMETVKLCELEDHTSVYIDRFAAEADGIVAVNRIKPHTNFRGRYESGLIKMLAVGLGKQQGAKQVHEGDPRLMGERVKRFGLAVLAHAPVVLGVAVVEDAYDQTYRVELLEPGEIEEGEPELLEESRRLMAGIRFKELDVLIVDQIGKDISGTGMDPNITHSYMRETGIDMSERAKRIVVLDLSPRSEGSASGLGLADITTLRVLEKMDPEKTYPNALTVGITQGPMIPMVMPNHRLAIQAAVHTVRAGQKGPRIVRIRDTLHLEQIEISEALMAEAEANPEIELLGEAAPLSFDSGGNLF